MAKNQEKKQKIISELKRHGNIARACRKTSVCRRLFYYWQSSDAEFKHDVSEAVRIGNE